MLAWPLLGGQNQELATTLIRRQFLWSDHDPSDSINGHDKLVAGPSVCTRSAMHQEQASKLRPNQFLHDALLSAE